jgi:hypothetical protein
MIAYFLEKLPQLPKPKCPAFKLISPVLYQPAPDEVAEC